jgi:hypothetical protein
MFRKYGTPRASILLAPLTILVALNTGAAFHANADTPLSLPPAVYASSGSGATSLAAADLNDDGKPDLVVSNTDSSNVAVL